MGSTLAKVLRDGGLRQVDSSEYDMNIPGFASTNSQQLADILGVKNTKAAHYNPFRPDKLS